MSASHCHSHGEDIHNRQILWTVLLLNLVMFCLEIWQGLQADSTSLLADSMDFLSDSFSYGITLYVLHRPLRVRARASLLKAALMLLIALSAFGQGIYNILHQQIPHYSTMGWVAFLALLINTLSAALLYKARGRDSNMRSIWLCSRNDALANIAVLLAAYAVYLTQSLWPDALVALFITLLAISAALQIIRQARAELMQK